LNGVWVDYSYVDSLKKYNSLTAVDSIIRFYPVFQFNEKERYQYVIAIKKTPHKHDLIPVFWKDSLEKYDQKNITNICFKTKNRSELQVELTDHKDKLIITFKKTNSSDEDKMLEQMIRKWFSGDYFLYDSNDQLINKIRIGRNGRVLGFKNYFSYSFLIGNWDGIPLDFIRLQEKDDRCDYFFYRYNNGFFELYDALYPTQLGLFYKINKLRYKLKLEHGR